MIEKELGYLLNRGDVIILVKYDFTFDGFNSKPILNPKPRTTPYSTGQP